MYEIKDAVVARIDSICKAKGITYNALANLAGITPSTVYSLMDPRRREVTVNTLALICDGLDISLDFFFDSDEFREMDEQVR